jgi:hypothetical protein
MLKVSKQSTQILSNPVRSLFHCQSTAKFSAHPTLDNYLDRRYRNNTRTTLPLLVSFLLTQDTPCIFRTIIGRQSDSLTLPGVFINLVYLFFKESCSKTDLRTIILSAWDATLLSVCIKDLTTPLVLKRADYWSTKIVPLYVVQEISLCSLGAARYDSDSFSELSHAVYPSAYLSTFACA